MLKFQSPYIPLLDGLRGVSILLVFIAHIGFEHLIPGGLGVTIFFFISGYIITKLLIDETNSTGEINLKSFYIRRLIRLYPPLLFMILLFFSYLYYSHATVDGHEIMASIFYYENYYFFFHPESSSNICKILWSLAVEEHFYLLFPLLFTAFSKSPKKMVTALIILTIIPLIFRCFGAVKYRYSADVTERYVYTLTHTRFDSIIYGCLASVLIYRVNAKRYLNLLANKYVFFIAFAILVTCLIFRDPFFRNTFRYSLQGLSLFILIPALINTKAYPKIKGFFTNRTAIFIGKLSYAIYLMHMLAISSLIFIKNSGQITAYYLAVSILTIALSSFVYFVIEKPCFKLRMKFKTFARFQIKDASQQTVIS